VDARAPASAPTSERASGEPLTPELASAEGLFAEQFLRDPAAAAAWYRRVIADPRAMPAERQRATIRQARCLRQLNRPDTAKGLLNELLRDPLLPADIRAEAQEELKRMPAVEPARLMPDDTVAYLELRDSGRLLDEIVDLLSRAQLDDLVRQKLVSWLRQVFLADLSKLLNRSILAELRKIEGVGLGFHNVRFDDVDGQPRLRTDVLFVLYTGESVATAGVLQWVLAGVLQPDVTLDGVAFFTFGSAAPNFRFAYEEGLLVACSDVRAGADAVLRHLGQRRGRTLYGVPEFQQRPAGFNAAAAAALYLDWPRFVDLAVRQAPEARREDADIIVDTLSLREIGPIFGSLDVQGDRGELELAASVRSTDALVYRLFQTPPLEPGWREWVPEGAIAGLVSGATPGERRWRDFERLIVELDRVQRLTGAARAESRPARTDPLSGLRAFEEAAQLSIAEHVCRPINGISVVLVDSGAPAREPDALPSLVLVLDVDQADAWRRRIERGLRRWLFGALSDAPLPTTVIETPVGPVEQLSLPRTRIGPAWQVQGRRVVLAFSVDALVSYLHAQTRERDRPAAFRGQTENKYIALQLDELLRLYYGVAPRIARVPTRPLVLRTYEREGRVRVLLEQDDLSAALRAVADVELARP
jgi:hypothetical protein